MTLYYRPPPAPSLQKWHPSILYACTGTQRWHLFLLVSYSGLVLRGCCFGSWCAVPFVCVCVCVCVILYGVGGTKHPHSSLENAPHNYLRIHPSMVITITYSLPEYSPLCTLNTTEYLPHNIIRHLNMLPKIPYSTPEYPHHNTI